MELLTSEAVVVTAQVEIRALTIRGKQVTLAVFRQLLERRLLDDSWELIGVPWGTVNYHPDRDCNPRHRHFHVVWQEGSHLRRATVFEPRQQWWRERGLSDGHFRHASVQFGKIAALEQLFIAV